MIDAEGYKLFLAVGFFLAAVHAHSKLSPYFAATWFGSGLVFAYFWADRFALELLLLPPLLFYMAAAATKGLVETRPSVRGNHVVHVIMTGVFSGVVALPLLASADAMDWNVPDGAPDLRFLSDIGAFWLGGVDPSAVAMWMVAGTVFYGVYKILDHIGIGRPAQTVLQFGVAPFLVPLIGALLGQG